MSSSDLGVAPALTTALLGRSKLFKIGQVGLLCDTQLIIESKLFLLEEPPLTCYVFLNIFCIFDEY